MGLIWTIVFMAAVGAAIGAVTNHYAIKMLFRPHEAKYIGSWRVPFTPGLIPKRRDELAKQLGNTVINHLLTPDIFKRKYFNDEMQEKTTKIIVQQLNEKILLSDKTIGDWLMFGGIENVASMANEKINEQVDIQFNRLKTRFEHETIRQLAPVDWQLKADSKVAEIVGYILLKGEEFFVSEEGKMTVKNLIDDFLSTKGTLGSMIQMFVGESSSLAGKVQPEILKFLRAPGTKNMLEKIVKNEWEKLKDRPVIEIMDGFDFEPVIANVKGYLTKQLAIEERLNHSLVHYFPEATEWAQTKLVPKLISYAFIEAEAKLEEILRKMKLEEMVKEQVDSFPVARLEEIVLGISKKEFKMITVLGGVLGGLIGIIQGLIVFFTS
ncbi:DUF445 domain-containing protein [Psychrobacillus vulpis]|uniref:DUF445 family protein n=1 Tax=Psychrobacillus vulpis TaxID=2325572 RepID=A0A544TNM7_9BACI|nr:DUF445 family protein [Psychrobacillus vulpis]TQR19062.1 DUF445 family protein [Psychrobacillus vulpis]